MEPIFTCGLMNGHPESFLYLRYGHRLVYDAGSKVEARLASVLKHKKWCWPAARSDEMVWYAEKIMCGEDWGK